VGKSDAAENRLRRFGADLTRLSAPNPGTPKTTANTTVI
jgi:hypothetical protein